jgi:hypothetical protein
MNQPTWAVLVLAGLAAGCELVAGIQDKYLAAADASGVEMAPPDTGSSVSDDATDAGTVRPPDATLPETTDAPPQVADAPEEAVAPADVGSPPADARAEASQSNAFTAPDAGTTDPSAPSAMQPSSFLFCDDFDSVTTIAQTWSWGIFTIDGGATGFTEAAYTSPMRSMQVVAPPHAPPPVELLGLDLGVLTNQVRLAFDLRVEMDSLSSLPTTAVAQILGARQGVGLELDYQLRPNQGALLQCFVSQDGGPSINIPLPEPPLRTWTRMVIAYDATAGITVYEDGAQIAANASAAGGNLNDTKIQVGMIYQNGVGSGTLQMEMDNVVVRGH